jgi:hypothetical protein
MLYLYLFKFIQVFWIYTKFIILFKHNYNSLNKIVFIFLLIFFQRDLKMKKSLKKRLLTIAT